MWIGNLNTKVHTLSLQKAFLQLSLASTSHFSMINLKANHPEKYNPTLHKILVGIWAVMVILLLTNFLNSCDKFSRNDTQNIPIILCVN
jgi:hypothetical protein